MEKKKTTKKDEGSSKGTGKTINLQGTARMKVHATQYGRDFAKQQVNQPIVNIVNTTDDKQVLEYMNSEDGERRITNIIRESAFNARRIQPLPDELQQDSQGRFMSAFAKSARLDWLEDTLKSQYRTRTARAIAAIRHTANNVRERVVDFLFPPWNV